MIDVHKLQCYTTAARLRGYADALQDTNKNDTGWGTTEMEKRYYREKNTLYALLDKAAALLEKEWDDYQKEMNARRNPTDN